MPHTTVYSSIQPNITIKFRSTDSNFTKGYVCRIKQRLYDRYSSTCTNSRFFKFLPYLLR